MKTSTGDIVAGYMLGLASLIFGLMIIFGNAQIFYKSYIKKEKTPSIGFLLGSILSTIGIFILFPKKYWWIAIIPILLDYGGIYSLIFLLYELIVYALLPKK